MKFENKNYPQNEYIGTQRMIVEPLTKALPPKTLMKHVNRMVLEDGKL